MSEPSPVIVTLVIYEDLCLVFKAPEGAGVDDPVPVALKFGSGRAFWLFKLTPGCLGRKDRVRHKARQLSFLKIFTEEHRLFQ
jgi:hypothetical protein